MPEHLLSTDFKAFSRCSGGLGFRQRHGEARAGAEGCGSQSLTLMTDTASPNQEEHFPQQAWGYRRRRESPDSGLMLTAGRSLCALRDQDKEVKKFFCRKKTPSFTSTDLPVVKKKKSSNEATEIAYEARSGFLL